ncbi:MAG: hypothetical protein HC857_12465 [Synechococcales cyanobacterium RU_4_20]|nr:hypothetical protein [Synechococcales cyanobacterium RU_4_20]
MSNAAMADVAASEPVNPAPLWNGGAAEAASLPSPEETFNTALIVGDRAAQTAQTAQTTTDWELAAARWEQALNLLKAIPSNSSLFGDAQSQIQTYDAQLQEARSQLAALRG